VIMTYYHRFCASGGARCTDWDDLLCGKCVTDDAFMRRGVAWSFSSPSRLADQSRPLAKARPGRMFHADNGLAEEGLASIAGGSAGSPVSADG
jgi:hypothetical protein